MRRRAQEEILASAQAGHAALQQQVREQEVASEQKLDELEAGLQACLSHRHTSMLHISASFLSLLTAAAHETLLSCNVEGIARS